MSTWKRIDVTDRLQVLGPGSPRMKYTLTATSRLAADHFDGVEDKQGTFGFEVDLVARQLVGIPFTEEITEATPGPLVVRLLTLDPLEKDTLFDGVDFAVLDADADGQVLVDPAATDTESVAAYNLFRRTFQTHDHFVVQSEE